MINRPPLNKPLQATIGARFCDARRLKMHRIPYCRCLGLVEGHSVDPILVLRVFFESLCSIFACHRSLLGVLAVQSRTSHTSKKKRRQLKGSPSRNYYSRKRTQNWINCNRPTSPRFGLPRLLPPRRRH